MYHIPVLLNETVDGLNIQPGGVYVDVTFGGAVIAAKYCDDLTTLHICIASTKMPMLSKMCQRETAVLPLCAVIFAI